MESHHSFRFFVIPKKVNFILVLYIYENLDTVSVIDTQTDLQDIFVPPLYKN